ncbi:hypothetical protein GQ457_04G038370 [Hibiscus cannabinus]
MAEGAELVTWQQKLQELQEGTNIPPWWEKQKGDLEDRLGQLEKKMDESQTDLRRIISLMTRAADNPESVTPERTNPQADKEQSKTQGKKAVHVTVIDDRERYSIDMNEPGVLAPKPLNIDLQDVLLKTQNNTYVAEGSRLGNFLAEKGGPSLPKESTLEKQSTHSPTQWNSMEKFNLKPKIELNMFEGQNPRGWVRKCQKYFAIFDIPEGQKLEIASMYLSGKAETWFDGYIMQKHRATWHEFTADLCHRFCDKAYHDVIEEFNKLMQRSTVEEYQERFEELKPFMLQHNPHLEEGYFVSSFISGLKEDIKHRVRVHEPRVLADAYRKAKLHELAMEIEGRKYKYQQKLSFSSNTQGTLGKTSNQPAAIPRNQPPGANQKQSLIEYRRAHNLCFKCGEKFLPGHQCKTRQLNLMVQTDELEEGLEEMGEEEPQMEMGVNGKETEESNLEISINALTGNVGHSTIRIQGTIKGKPLSILVDSGSTHSFITSGWAKEGVELVYTNPLVITVANGEKLLSNAKSNQLEWKMQGYLFEHDFRVLPMGGSDMVLGVDWMRKYSPIVMDFNAMTLSFKREEQNIILQGGKRTGGIKMISGEKLQKMAMKDPELMGELYLLSAEAVETKVPESLLPILDRYKRVFEEPQGMPPKRSQDHAIILKPDSQPVNLRPYRFPYFQKSEVERQVKEMLASSIIQTSQSPFASPCLLVKKKDGSWRLCVDYRQLNDMTVKNKFPIPVVDDLLDELSGSNYFSKIDLRSGYWQIRIKEEDIPKTSFRTHHGHFEFKVMPFGLTNAPATFQSLMNDLFGPYLRKFVLVFFDDILIYSQTLADHENHLQVVLELLHLNKLFAKRNKCFFGQRQVEYLGHIISRDGVATDPAKSLVVFAIPIKFALLFTFGNVLAVGSTAFLMGPEKQLRMMFDSARVYATAVYIGFVVLALICALWIQSKILTLLAIICEICALVWYCLSYIPFARRIVSNLMIRFCDTEL